MSEAFLLSNVRFQDWYHILLHFDLETSQNIREHIINQVFLHYFSRPFFLARFEFCSYFCYIKTVWNQLGVIL